MYCVVGSDGREASRVVVELIRSSAVGEKKRKEIRVRENGKGRRVGCEMGGVP